MRTPHFASLILVLSAVVTFPATAAIIRVPDEAPTIQAGIDAAAYGDTVLVACGTYNEHDIVMKSGVLLTSETGLANCAAIDAWHLGRVFHCEGVDGPASIVGFTIARGLTDGGAPSNCGGGVYCKDSSLQIAECLFWGNHAGVDSVGNGGGLYCESSSLTLSGCMFEDNQIGTDMGGCGGGLYCKSSSLTLMDCQFRRNEAGTWGPGFGRGGGMHCSNCPSLALTDCVFEDNHSSTCGGMYCEQSSPMLTNCRFSHNSAYAGSVGGLMCTGESSPTVTDCEFSGNGGWAGGAVGIWSSSPTFTDCVFTGNFAMIGGAMSFGSSSSTLTRCTFLDNNAGGGGAFDCSGTAASPEFICCTFSGNGQQGADGTAVSSVGGASPTLTQCIIAFGTSGPVVFCSGGTVALSCCDIYGNASGDWVGCIADQYGVDGNVSEDPLFCLGDNPEMPYTLHEGSPCLPENSPCGELVGAFGQGCDQPSIVEDLSWGAIKVRFR